MDEVRLTPAGDPFHAAAQDHPHASWSGWVFVGYVDEEGEEQVGALPCRRCAAEAKLRGVQ